MTASDKIGGRVSTPPRQGGRTSEAVHSVERDLEVLGTAPRYYDWIVQMLAPWCGRVVLECGAGSGHVTTRLMALRGPRVVASEIEPAYLPALRALCQPPHSGPLQLDLEHLDEASLAAIRQHGTDTVLMVNVLEHIVNDRECVQQLAKALPPGGRILIMVPAHPALFSRLDAIYGHHRRYRRADLARLTDGTGVQVRFARSMNLPGALAWWVIHRLLGRTALTPAGTRVFNHLVPAIAACERLVPPPFGQSLVAVLERL